MLLNMCYDLLLTECVLEDGLKILFWKFCNVCKKLSVTEFTFEGVRVRVTKHSAKYVS